MAIIPKKVSDRFTKAVPKFKKVLQIAKDRDINESDTVSVINDILGDVFGYDKYIEVTSELAIRGTYCDLALKVDNKIEFLIEAKAIGIQLKDTHVKQAIDYGANKGVEWVVLTNGIEWRIYRIRFEQPLNYDLVCTIDFMAINPRDEGDQERLFLISKEGLDKKIRASFYDKFQNVNRYVIGALITSEPVLTILRRELKKLADGIKIEAAEIEQILTNEVLKREILIGDEADAARSKIGKFYRKVGKKAEVKPTPTPPKPGESVSEKLLRETSNDTSNPVA